jgi:YfiH family protein
MQNGFVSRKTNGLTYYACRAIEDLSIFHHGFSTRYGGAPDDSGSFLNLGYTPWDNRSRVDANRERFVAALNLDPNRLVALRQIHSDRIHILEDDSLPKNQLEGDALITRVENIALAVQIADCFPVLIADPVKKAGAVVHSGWRGTLSCILRKTILAMERAFQSDPSQLVVAIGPGIRSCCFEVGEEVAGPFQEEYPDAGLVSPVSGSAGKYMLDLPKALEIQLKQAGVNPDMCYDLGACTRCNVSEFFSFRAEGKNSGRMMAVIAAKRSALK